MRFDREGNLTQVSRHIMRRVWFWWWVRQWSMRMGGAALMAGGVTLLLRHVHVVAVWHNLPPLMEVGRFVQFMRTAAEHADAPVWLAISLLSGGVLLLALPEARRFTLALNVPRLRAQP